MALGVILFNDFSMAVCVQRLQETSHYVRRRQVIILLNYSFSKCSATGAPRGLRGLLNIPELRTSEKTKLCTSEESKYVSCLSVDVFNYLDEIYAHIFISMPPGWNDRHHGYERLKKLPVYGEV